MLDLGVWVALQSVVESIHKGKVMQCDELAKSVITAFNSIDASVFDKVHERWKLVLHLIMSGKGTNEVVEQHRGLNKKLTDLPTTDDDEDEDQEYGLVKMMHELNINGDDYVAGGNDDDCGGSDEEEDAEDETEPNDDCFDD